MNKEQKTFPPEESHMSLSEALDILHSVRDMYEKGNFDKTVIAFNTVFKWIDDFVSFFNRIGK